MREEINLDKTSGIRRVSYYMASPVSSSCDRCSAAIKHVFVVEYRDGQTLKYGSECINRILDHEPSLRKLYDKNVKTLQRYQRALEALSLPFEQMPRGAEYYGSGLYFIADSKGNDVMTTHFFFHPLYDAKKNAAGRNYVVTDPADRLKRCVADIEQGKQYLVAEITRIEGFLGRVLAKCEVSL